jgi:ubiquinone/menaquinone biosynthesis C-methylase UbiE
MNQDLISYYKDRAKEYEKIYSIPERQADLKNSGIILQNIFDGKHVLEIACGTGYWTERIATTAASIFATDINETVLEIAKQKGLPNQVTFGVADIYNFPDRNKFESLFGGFIWSHILLQDLDKFLSTINSFVSPGGIIVFMDNNFVKGSNHDIAKTDEQGNTYQARKLENNTSHLVLKNFPTKDFVLQKLSSIATEINFINFTYYWLVSCKLTENRNDK